jgi:hypothetical protein
MNQLSRVNPYGAKRNHVVISTKNERYFGLTSGFRISDGRTNHCKRYVPMAVSTTTTKAIGEHCSNLVLSLATRVLSDPHGDLTER